MTGNILIIDDEEQLRKLLSRIIGLEEFSVSVADHGWKSRFGGAPCWLLLHHLLINRTATYMCSW